MTSLRTTSCLKLVFLQVDMKSSKLTINAVSYPKPSLNPKHVSERRMHLL